MSATGRGAAREPLDFYRTPKWCVDALLEREKFPPLVLDPGCGDGSILKALRAAKRRPGAFRGFGVELDPERAAEATRAGLRVIEGDFLFYASRMRGLSPAAAVVGNPPYRLAADFARAALELVPHYAKVAFLLRLNFLGSSRRRIDLVGERSPLRRVIVLSKRPSFTGGRTDACEYAWFVWVRNYRGPASLSVAEGAP